MQKLPFLGLFRPFLDFYTPQIGNYDRNLGCFINDNAISFSQNIETIMQLTKDRCTQRF